MEKTLAVEQPILLPTEANSFSSSKGKVSKHEKIVPVIYEVEFQDAKLVINLVQGTSLNPAYKKLEVDFTEVNTLTGKGKTLKAINWRIQ